MASRESKSRYAILGALTLEPMSGYQIKELIGRTIGHFWNEGYGQIYPTLKALAEAGLVSSRIEPGNGKPDSNVYSLTDAGWEELRQWLARPVDSNHPGRSELLLKLFFGRHAAADRNLEHVRRYRELLGALIAQYEAIEFELMSEDDPDQPYWLITLRHGLHVARASRAWCDETIYQMAQLSEERP
jgi:PadR family transcriptional regulator AphA